MRINNYLDKYPAISDLAKRAKKRIPNVAWQYLETGTGDEYALQRNLNAFRDVIINPQMMKGEQNPSYKTELLGKKYNSPFGMAPVGLSGLMWPGAEMLLADTAKRYNIPYCLSTVATQTPETIGPIVDGNGWFQLYSPRQMDIRLDVLKRAKDNGFETLVVTADVPKPSRRERTKRAGLRNPPKITLDFILDGILCPRWTMQYLKHGKPALKTVLKYADGKSTKVFEEIRAGFGGTLSWDYCKELRDQWQGPMIIKGLTHPDDAQRAVDIGADGIIVSNHGGRQFDAVPSALSVLPHLVETVDGKLSVMYDSGIRSGLDVIKALYLGADFVFLGRPFLYGVAALGKYGADHVCDILNADLDINMLQLGIESLSELRKL